MYPPSTRPVEKPSLENAPSNLAIVGRYVLMPDIFNALREVEPGISGEIQLTDAIELTLCYQPTYACQFPGVHFDAGTPLGLLKASVYAALQNEDISTDLVNWLNRMVA